MRRLLVLAAVAAFALAGCGSGSSGSTSGSGGDVAAAGGSSSPSPGAVLRTWESPVGEIVVTAQGRAVYVFDKDTAGAATSACTGQCASLWPALTTTSATPSVSGVTGKVGTAPAADGARQLTLDGHRLYTFSGDSGAQQVNGQGFTGIWWVVAPDGRKITTTSASSSAVQAPGY